MLNVLLKNSRGQTLYEAEQVGACAGLMQAACHVCTCMAPAKLALPASPRGCAGSAQRQQAHSGPAAERETATGGAVAGGGGAGRVGGAGAGADRRPAGGEGHGGLGSSLTHAELLLTRAVVLLQVEVDEGSMVESVEMKESQSYPGLLSKVLASWSSPGGQPCSPPACGGSGSRGRPATIARLLGVVPPVASPHGLLPAVCVQAGERPRAERPAGG